MADVGRPKHDLGEHPRQRARLERDRPALAVDGRPRHPAAATGQVDDDVAGPGVELDPGGDDAGGGGGASRSKTGSEWPGSAEAGVPRPVIAKMLADASTLRRMPGRP